jgi:hypothetical protein
MGREEERWSETGEENSKTKGGQVPTTSAIIHNGSF